MTDAPGSRPETDLDRLRRKAFAEEGEALRSVLKEELANAVREVVRDPGVKEVLRKELTEQLVGRVSAEIAKQLGSRLVAEVKEVESRIIEEIRRDFLGYWAKTAKKALRDGFESARADFSSDQCEAVGVKTPWPGPLPTRQKRSQGGEEFTGNPSPAPDFEFERPPTSPRLKSGFSLLNLSNRDKAFSLILILSLALALYVIGWLLTARPQNASRQATSQVTPNPPPTTEDHEPLRELTPAADRLQVDWTKSVSAAEDELPKYSRLPRLLSEHPFQDQFSCWFNAASRDELERLARGAVPSDDVQQQLESAFEPCFSREPSLRDPHLAIFSAQATVKQVFSKYQSEWESWCVVGNEARFPVGLIADGVPGHVTEAGMNLFLTCTGHSSDLAIGPDATASEYLYITYLALREMQR